jgi:hypothetical protein
MKKNMLLLAGIAFFSLILNVNTSLAQSIDVGARFDLNKETVHHLTILPIIFEGMTFQPEEYLEYFEAGLEITLYLIKGLDSNDNNVLYGFSNEEQLNENRFLLFAKRLNKANQDSFSDLDEAFESLSNGEKYKVVELAKSLEPTINSRRTIAGDDSSFRSEVFKKAARLADLRYGKFLPTLSELEIKNLLEEVLSSDFPGRTLSEVAGESLQRRNACPVYGYTGKIKYGSVSNKINKPTSIVRANNTAGESPCDFEVRFKYGNNSKIYSDNWFKRKLMSSSTGFGGTMISRENGKYVLFGYWRTVFWIGPAWFIESTFKTDLYAW